MTVNISETAKSKLLLEETIQSYKNQMALVVMRLGRERVKCFRVGYVTNDYVSIEKELRHLSTQLVSLEAAFDSCVAELNRY